MWMRRHTVTGRPIKGKRQYFVALAFVFCVASLLLLVPVFSMQFTDHNQTLFDLGTYDKTEWNNTSNFLQLNWTGARFELDGNYTSRTLNATTNASWINITLASHTNNTTSTVLGYAY